MKRELSLLTSFLEGGLFTGCVLGWSSLVYLLKVEEFFINGCEGLEEHLLVNDDEFAKVNKSDLGCTNGSSNGQHTACSYQDDSFQSIYIISAGCINFACLFIGWIMDTWGTLYARLTACFMTSAGTLLMSFISAENSYWMYIAMPLIASGGSGLMVTNMQLSNFFPKFRAFIITFQNGLYGSSSAVFLLFKWLHSMGFTVNQIFSYYSILSIFCIVRTIFCMPKYSVPFDVPDDYTFKKKPTLFSDHDEALLKEKPPKEENLTPESFGTSIKSLLFMLNIFYFAVLVIRWNYFISSFNAWITFTVSQLDAECIEGENIIGQYTNIFGLVQMLEAFCLAPFVGGTIDFSGWVIQKLDKEMSSKELRLKQNISSIILCIMIGLISCLLPLMENLKLQIVTIVIACLYRSFLVGTTASFLSLCFPSEHLGKLYGITRTIGGLSTFLAVPLFKLVVYLGNRYDCGNGLLAVSTGSTLIFPIYIWRISRKDS